VARDETEEKAKDEPKEDSSEEQGESEEEYSTEEELTEKSDHGKKEELAEDHEKDSDHIENEKSEAVGHSEEKRPDLPVSLLGKDSRQEEKEVEVNTRQTATTLRWIF
jgi:hypothetical protein